MTTYGGRLRQLREKQRLSQQEVADFLEISQSTYSLWESDKYTPQIEILPKLAELFKVDIGELVPKGTTVKIVNSHSQIDNSIVGFEVNMATQVLYKDLLESKDEIIRLLRDEIQRLKEKIGENTPSKH